MSVKQVYPGLPPLARGQACPLKLDIKGEKLLYKQGNTVVLRDVKPAADGSIGVQLYTQHLYPVTAAAMAPSGCYVASGDDHGNLRVWACDNPEQPIKLEAPMFAGEILDIAWSGDSQRILVVGNGGQVFGRVIMWDSGNSVGEVSGHQKKINSCSFKTTRPFRLVTGGEDNKVCFHEGPPFKFKANPKTHERFVNTTRFSADGARFFSASSDSVVAVFDGKEGTMTLEKKVHGGSIFDAAWSPDSSKILTASGDGSAKVLDAATLEEAGCFNFKSGDRKKTVAEQQVGCAWGACGLLTYGLGGELRLFESEKDTAPTLVQYGHQKAINCIAHDGTAMYTGSYDDATGTLRGTVLSWDLGKGVATPLDGDGHTNGVMGIGICGATIVTCATDDHMMFSTPPTFGKKVPLGACPVGFATSASLAVAVTTADKVIACSVAKQDIVAEVKLGFSPTCVAVAPSDGLLAVGGEDNLIHLLNPDASEKSTLAKHREKISAVAFSPQSDKLVSGCANKEIVVWDCQAGTPLVTGLQGFHTARISCLAWAPDGSTFASGGVDAQIIVWEIVDGKGKAKHKLPLAHTSGAIRGLAYSSAAELFSAGSDACVKKWAV